MNILNKKKTRLLGSISARRETKKTRDVHAVEKFFNLNRIMALAVTV
ncbi:MAG: hypothetical protein ACE5MK_00185 [Acidobacteriota bacterium]